MGGKVFRLEDEEKVEPVGWPQKGGGGYAGKELKIMAKKELMELAEEAVWHIAIDDRYHCYVCAGLKPDHKEGCRAAKILERQLPNPVFENALTYIRNTGENATVENFIADHAPVGKKLWEDLRAADLVGVTRAGKIFALSDSDRFLIFMALLDPEQARQQAATKSQEDLVALFERMTGWEHQRALSAFEVCVVKGHIDKK